MDNTLTLAWPHNKRHLLPPGHTRELYDTQRDFRCYRNLGRYPEAPIGAVPPFRTYRNRETRRGIGQRGDGYGVHYEPRTSPRAARPYDGSTHRASVHERQRRRAPGRVAGILRGVPLSVEERASGRYFVATPEQAQLLRDLMRGAI